MISTIIWPGMTNSFPHSAPRTTHTALLFLLDSGFWILDSGFWILDSDNHLSSFVNFDPSSVRLYISPF